MRSAYLTGRLVQFFLPDDIHDLLKLTALTAQKTTRSIVEEVVINTFRRGKRKEELLEKTTIMIKESWTENYNEFTARGERISVADFKETVVRDLKYKGLSEGLIKEIMGRFDRWE